VVPAIEEEGRVAWVENHGQWEIQKQNKQLLKWRERERERERERGREGERFTLCKYCRFKESLYRIILKWGHFSWLKHVGYTVL